MNKLTFTLNAILGSAILLSTLSVQGMENYEQLVLYNKDNCPLTNLPKETLNYIFSHCLSQKNDQMKSLKNSVKTFMRLSRTCKNFNRLLTFELIGNFYKNYPMIDTIEILKMVVKTMEADYEINRPLALILVYAGTNANPHTFSANLLNIAASSSDTQLIKALFKCHANPRSSTQICKSTSALRRAKTVEMAHIFIDNGADIHSTNFFQTNVLNATVRSGYQSELIEFYLSHHVDAKQLSTQDNSCLFHELVKAQQVYAMDAADDLLKKAKLLLEAIPDMINTVDKYGRTPVDVAQLRLELHKQLNDDPEVLKQLITLFKEHGGVTAQELEQETPDFC